MSRIFNDGSNSAAQGHYFNGMYLPDTPLWYMQGADTSAGHANLAVFGASSHDVPLAGITQNGYSHVGGTGQQGYILSSEASGYRPHGYNTTLSTQQINPHSGYMGISCDGDGFNHRSEILDSRGALLPVPYGYTHLASLLGVVIGEAGYKRGINLYLNGTTLYLRPFSPVPNSYAQAQAGRGKLALTGDHLTLPSSGKFSEMRGSIGYNRRSNTLMLVQHSNGTSYQYFRLHIWRNLPRKLSLDSSDLDAMLKAAKAGDDYSYHDYRTDSAGGYAGTNDRSWYANIKVVPCDDGTAWLCHRYTSKQQLFSYDGSAVTLAHSLSGSSSQGEESGGYYATKHQLSFDQSRIAIYAPYYHYLNGCNIFYCDTASASAFSYWQLTQNSNHGMSIAPVGGRAFAVMKTGNMDINTGMYQLQLLDQPLSEMTGASHPDRSIYPAFSGFSTSTNYSGVWLGRILHHPAESTEFAEGLLTF